ncbi:amino acid kinase family protein [Chitinimonas arctica]|nr:acetylglutamate kinase [Chitinimonas arctica]
MPKAPALTPMQADQASLLASSLPFVQSLQQQTVVIVYAGSANAAPCARQTFAQEVALLALTGVRPVVVHGGAPQFRPFPPSSRALLPERVAMHVARAALADINLELVQLISQHGPKAVGVKGQDGDCLTASSQADANRICPIVKLDVTLFKLLQNNGMLPIVMPIAPDAKGEDRQLSSELLGALLAQQLRAVTLIWMGEGAILQELTGLRGPRSRAELESWLAQHPQSAAAPAVGAALDALGHGVQSVHFVDAGEPYALISELLTDEGCGLAVCRRSGAQMLADSTRYLHDCNCAL